MKSSQYNIEEKLTFRTLREQSGITIAELADILNKSSASIRQWEALKSHVKPPQEAIDALLDLVKREAQIVSNLLTDIEKHRRTHVVLYLFEEEQQYMRASTQHINFHHSYHLPMSVYNYCIKRAYTELMIRGYDAELRLYGRDDSYEVVPERLHNV